MTLFQLASDVTEAHDGSGNQLRKHGDVKGEINYIHERTAFSPVDIDNIAEFLECKKRNSYGQDNFIPLDREESQF
jgi:hypothetical protein